MRQDTMRRLLTVAAGCFATATAVPAAGQAWHYPGFQTPVIERRELGGGFAAAGDAGTSIFGQWREGLGPNTQLSFDFGFNDPKAGDMRVLLGGALGYRVAQANAQMPLDMVLTGGFYPSFGGDLTVIRIPVGLSAGRRFGTQSGIGVTPYAHPRISFDLCAGGDVCDATDDESEISINFELGVGLDLTSQFAIRGGFVFSSNDSLDDVAFGLGFYYRPRSVAAGR